MIRLLAIIWWLLLVVAVPAMLAYAGATASPGVNL